MSLITRCPACATMFKVVPDQLRISEGWVRCGHCSEVFDAAAHLQHAAVKAAEPVEAPAEQRFEPPVRLAPEQLAEPEPEPALEPEPEPEQGPITAGVEAEPPQQVVEEAVAAQASESAPIASIEPFEAAENEPAAASESTPTPDPAAGPTESTLQDMSFVRDARRKAFWRRPLVRAAMLLVCLALLAGLGLQMAVHQRDLLAAAEPRTRPWLEAACEPLKCQVQPLRQIESITIENSSFNKVRGDAYRLGLAVRNKSVLALAMPGIELTLTDAQDRAVLRRVLLPRDLGAAPVLAPGAEWSANLPVNVAGANSGNRISGYRVLAFYP